MKDRELDTDEHVFDFETRIVLSDVLAACAEALTGSRLRDVRSAFRFLEKMLDVDLDATMARPKDLRRIFEKRVPSSQQVSPKRLANVRSLLAQAVRAHGIRRTCVTRDVEFTPPWQDLMDRIAKDEYRWGLNRFAAYCSIKGIAPEDVCPETLIGFEIALDRNEVSKSPQKLRKHTIAIWNKCRKTVPNWPDIRLEAPNKKKAFMLALEDFPDSFQLEVLAWEQRMTDPDPLDPDAPPRGLRPDTLISYRFTFRRLTSALVHGGYCSIEEVTSLAILFAEDNFRNALRPFLKGAEISSNDYAYKMARQMLTVGENFLKLPEDQLHRLKTVTQRLKPRNGSGMGKRNRERLHQFDDDTIVRKLLGFPKAEVARALSCKNPVRRAKAMERALIVSLLLTTGLRIKNLRMMDLERNLIRRGKRVFLAFGETEMKTHVSHDLELTGETVELLEKFLTEHRKLLPGDEGPYLFPGETGGPRSYSAMRDAVGRSIRQHTGIEISPHLFRHIIAKIVAERAPEALIYASRMLGHKNFRTTYQRYLGTEGPAASRHINAILQTALTKDRSGSR